MRSSLCENRPRFGTLNQADRALSLEIETPGLLETLFWKDSTFHNRSPNADEVRIQVKMVALNFKNRMIAMGQLEDLSSMRSRNWSPHFVSCRQENIWENS